MSAPVIVVRHELVLSPETERALVKLGETVGRMLAAGWPVSPGRVVAKPRPAVAPEAAPVEAREAPRSPAAFKLPALPRWSEERDAVLREGWPRGEMAPVLLERVNALPGPAVPTVDAIKSRAKSLGLRLAVGVSRRCGPPKLWSEERRAVLQEGWPRGDSPEALLERVNALPGPPVRSAAGVLAQAKRCGLHRDPAIVAAARDVSIVRARETRAALRAATAVPATHEAEPASEPPSQPEAAESEPEPAPEPEPETPLPPAPEAAPEPAPPPAPEPAPPEPAPALGSEPEPQAAPGEIVPDRPEFTCLGKPLTRPQVVDNAERLGLRFTGDLTALNRKRAHAGYPPIEALVPNRPVQWWKK